MINILKHITNSFPLGRLGWAFLVIIMTSCSQTSSLEPGEQLYTGLKPIQYSDANGGDHLVDTKTEIEAALAAAPNGALFGSSYHRTIFPYGLWIWNAFADGNDWFSRWITNSFGKAPVVMSEVNPELRVGVAQSVLANNGYFQGKVDYDIIEGKNTTTKKDSISRPHTAKIAYKVDFGPLYTIDSVEYRGFTPEQLDILNPKSSTLNSQFSTLNSQFSTLNSQLAPGSPFSVSALDAERIRIYNAFRNNGYYYYNKSYITFLADTTSSREAKQITNHQSSITDPEQRTVSLRLQQTDSLPDAASRRYAIGNLSIDMRQQYGEALHDSISFRRFKMRFNGSKPPVRPRVIFNNWKMRRGQMFSQDSYEESQTLLSQTGIFSSVDLQFIPRTSNLQPNTSNLTPDTLDILASCIIDRPYDITLSANYKGKTSGRMGPGVGLNFAKRNAFRGGEVVSLNFNANYEFQVGSGTPSADNNNSYEFGGDLIFETPRLLLPRFLIGKRRRWRFTPSTTFSFAAETINRSGFFRRNIFSGQLTYNFQPSLQSRHQFSPLIISYDKLATITDAYMEKVKDSPTLLATMENYTMTKMRYTYTYTSPVHYRHPIFFSTSLTESSNLLNLIYAATGKPWNEKGKQLLAAPYSQFLKLDAEYLKTWRISQHSTLLAHAQLGYIHCLGNSISAPFSELYYIGGPNTLRGFSARSIGPGRQLSDGSNFDYILRTGDTMMLLNLEYRTRLFGSLYGALFVDAGNIYDTDTHATADAKFRISSILTDLALNTGAGIRYDLDFFVIRLDLGIGLHNPSIDDRRYFNVRKLKDMAVINFAIGYPF